MPSKNRRKGESDAEYRERRRLDSVEYRKTEAGRAAVRRGYEKRRTDPEKVAADRERLRITNQRRRDDPVIGERVRAQTRAYQRAKGIGGWDVPTDASCELCGAHRPADGVRTTLTNIVQDHDHATGTLRGFLCGRCNRSLGLIEADTDWTNRALVYLQRWSHG